MKTEMGKAGNHAPGIEERIVVLLRCLRCDEPAPAPSPDFMAKVWALIDRSRLPVRIVMPVAAISR
jgi:hypothetical protein